MRTIIMSFLCLTFWVSPQIQAYSPNESILPAHRIVAYYGNFYSPRMGVLGEYPPEEMLQMLQNEVSAWEAADPQTPVIPAIDYIAVVAQREPGKDGKYIQRMPAEHIERALALANQVDGLLFLDIQVGHSSVQAEIPRLAPYLALPNVMLALDPEFDMEDVDDKPGRVMGTLSANDINYAIDYLAQIVEENNLPPKVLVIHRFTKPMVTNAAAVSLRPEVQVVMDMDGWGSKEKKLGTYRAVIAPEPVQFTGFKIFYKNDLKPPSTGLYTPQEVLELKPQPVFILYQ